mmetsp:Transcript_4137/g.11529  ORF Transcript_4137/g.11529 Transcript_4137/m.11529 type:complete len:242 (-) Transcript_4137:796-1521(-)
MVTPKTLQSVVGVNNHAYLGRVSRSHMYFLVSLLRLVFFQLSSLVHFLLGQADSFTAELPHLLGCLKIPYSIRLLIFEDLTTRASSPSWLSVRAPTTDGLGTSVPTPVYPRLVAQWVINHLGKTLPGLLFTNVTTSDILHEKWEQLSEPLSFLAEQVGLCNATRVHTRENNSGILMVSSVKFRDGHHVAYLGVFVCLCTKERFSICHGNRCSGSFFKSLKFSQVGTWVNQASSDRVGVPGN